MSLDTFLFYAGIGLEAAILAVFLFRRVFRLLPVFTIYIAYSLINDVAMMMVSRYFPSQYLSAYSVQLWLDAILQFGVLVELAWSVLRPYRNALPRATIFIVAALVLVAFFVVWPITGALTLSSALARWHFLWRSQQTFAILRILFFLALVAFSQLLAIGWRDRELQVTTGLGFYSLFSLAASILHTRHALPDMYHHIDQVVAFSYFGSLLYWTLSFLQREAPRQEFSPRMESLLLSVAGAARANRVSIEDLRKSKTELR